MALASEKIKECLIQGLKYYHDRIDADHAGIVALKAAVIALEPNIDSILTEAEQTALNNSISDQNDICTGQVYSVIAGKPSHPSHDWRRILDIE